MRDAETTQATPVRYRLSADCQQPNREERPTTAQFLFRGLSYRRESSTRDEETERGVSTQYRRVVSFKARNKTSET